MRAGAAHMAGKKNQGGNRPRLVLCLEVWRVKAASQTAAQTFGAAANRLAGVPGTLANVGIVGHGLVNDRRLCGRSEQQTANGSMDHLELRWRALHIGLVLVGSFTGLSISG